MRRWIVAGHVLSVISRTFRIIGPPASLPTKGMYVVFSLASYEKPLIPGRWGNSGQSDPNSGTVRSECHISSPAPRFGKCIDTLVSDSPTYASSGPREEGLAMKLDCRLNFWVIWKPQWILMHLIWIARSMAPPSVTTKIEEDNLRYDYPGMLLIPQRTDRPDDLLVRHSRHRGDSIANVRTGNSIESLCSCWSSHSSPCSVGWFLPSSFCFLSHNIH